MSTKKAVIVLGVIIVVLLGILIFYNPAQSPTTETSPANTPPTSQEAISPDGHVTVFSPLIGSVVVSPLSIQGTVVGGGWFNEASFPVKVLDGDGTVLGQGTAQAGGVPGSWMSTGTVTFSASITFTVPKYATGTIVLAKDNPSGAAANAEHVSIPVKFQ